MNFLAKACGLSLLILVSGSSLAQGAADDLLIHLQAYQQLRGQFTQIISSEQNTRTQSSSGEFWLSKPNKFRWHYASPYVQEIISNGQKVWIYDEDLEQVTIKQASQSIASSPLAIILGSRSLGESFDVVELAETDGLRWLQLSPKSDDTGFELMKLGFKQGILSRMELLDNFSQITHLLFTGVELNPQIDAQVFDFEVPAGADVFDEANP